MTYEFSVSIPFLVKVEGTSEEEAKKKIVRQLVNSKTIKPCDVIYITRIQEAKIREDEDEVKAEDG